MEIKSTRNVSVIIGFNNIPGRSDIDFVTNYGGIIKRIYRLINAISVDIPKESIDIIVKSPNVEYVENDEKVFAHVPIGTCREIQVLKQKIPWNISRIGATWVHSVGNTGKGVKVGILDTGIDYNHEDLKGNYRGGYNFIEDNNDTMDFNGHGCCHPDTKIFTTFCGVNTIEYFYDHVNNDEIINEDGSSTKLLDRDIYTISICPAFENKNKRKTIDYYFGLDSECTEVKMGKLEKRAIKSVHKIPIINNKDGITAHNIVQINDLFLTPWHKCFVFNRNKMKIEEKRADNVVIGDYLVSPGKFIDINDDYRKDESVCLGTIDEDLAYILGVIAGDGSVNLADKRIELSIDNMEIIKKCINICHKLRYKVTDPRWDCSHYYEIIIYSEKLTRFCHDNIKTSFADAKIPDIIIKSPFNVLISFISGVIDTDGNIKDGGTRIRISSSSKEGMIDRLYNILSIIGLKPGIIKVADEDTPSHYLNGRLIKCSMPNYQIVFHADIIGNRLMKYMAHRNKKDLLKIQLNKNNSIPISQYQLRRYLENNYWIRFDNDHKCKCCGKIRLSLNNITISKRMIKEIFEILGHKEDYLYQICDNFNFTVVTNIKKKEYNGYFYDLTMENSNNYIAGMTDMVFIHNTHVAGIVAAEDNDIGIVGVAPQASIYSVKVLSFDSTGSTSNILGGLDWSVENGMQIINMSLGSDDDSISIGRAVNATYNAGILIVSAAGNSGNPAGTGNTMDFPAKYDGVISVGATDKDDKRAPFSSTGPKLELSAPGANILSTLNGNKYGVLSGTSMSSPHVTGVAALIMSSENGITNVRTRIRMQMTAQNISKDSNGNMKGFSIKSEYGYGLVDAVKAVSLM